MCWISTLGSDLQSNELEHCSFLQICLGWISNAEKQRKHLREQELLAVDIRREHYRRERGFRDMVLVLAPYEEEVPKKIFYLR